MTTHAKRAARLAGIRAEIEQRVGLFPAFFRLAEAPPERLDTLWRQARESYLDNPLPPLFKEKLFTYLSRFSSSPYCMVRHAAFLLGRGRVAGDRAAKPLSVDEVAGLLRKPYPSRDELRARLQRLGSARCPLRAWPKSGGELEDCILACATPVFLRQPEGDGDCPAVLRGSLGRARWEDLLALLGFVRAAHFWTENHPELELDEDLVQLLREAPALAAWVREYRGVVREELSAREGLGILAPRHAAAEAAEAAGAQALAQCRENEKRLRFALEISHTGVWDLNPTDLSAYRSLEHDRIFGYPELLPRWTYAMFLDHVVPEDRAAVDRSFRRALQARENWSVECRIRRADGALRWIRVAGGYRPKAMGKRARMTGIVRDITARKAAEASLKQSEDLQQRVFQSLTAHIAVVAADGAIVAVNEAWTRFAEQNQAADSPSVRVGANYLDVCRRSLAAGDADAEAALKGIEAVIGGRKDQFVMEYPCHSPVEERWFSMTVVPLREQGWSGAVISHLNVTERRQAEDALRRSEAESQRQRDFLECLVEQAGCCIGVVQGKDLRFTLVNPAYQAISPESPMLGRTYREVFPEAAAAGAEAMCRHVLATGQPWRIENYRAQIPGRPDASWQGQVVRLPVRPGEEASLLGVVWEVTDRLRMEEALRQSEARYRGLVEQALDGIFVSSPSGCIQVINAAGARMWGFRVEELLGMQLVEAVMPEEAARIPREIAKLRDGSVNVTEWRCRRKDGSWFVGEVVGRLLPDGCLQGIVRDITERHHARLHAEFLSRLQLELMSEPEPAPLLRLAVRSLAEHLEVERVGFGVFNAECSQLTIVASLQDEQELPRQYNVADFGAAELLKALAAGQGVAICDLDSDPRTRPHAERYRRLGVAALACEPLTRIEGLKAVVMVGASQPRRWRPDELQLLREGAMRIFGAFERAQAQENLRASEERFRLAIKATNDAIWDFDLVTGRVSWNENYTKLYGRSEDTANSLEWWIEHIHPEDRDRVVDSLRRAIDGQDSLWVCEYRFRRKEGGWAFIDDRGYLLRSPEGRAVRVFGAMHDLTARKRAEMALRASEERLRLAQVAAGVGIWEWKPRTGAMEWSSELERIFGYQEGTFPGTLAALAERVHPEDRPGMLQRREDAISEHRDFDLDYRVRLPSGEIRWVNCKGAAIYDADGHPERVFAANVDVTARKEAEIRLAASLEELQRTQSELMRRERLALLGQLAGCLAHELRTPLAVMLNSIFFLEQLLPAGDATLAQVLGEMRRAVGNSDSIISEMLDYVREPHPLTADFRAGDAVAHALHLVSLPDSVRLVPMPREMEEVPVHASLEQVTRILVNLIRNAVQAMPQGGNLEIRAGKAGADRVCVEVRDTGCGIPEAHLEKIFEPLFSTKVTGIGLGLPIALRYARFNGGDLWVESTEGRGSIFRLVLPTRADPQAADGD